MKRPDKIDPRQLKLPEARGLTKIFKPGIGSEKAEVSEGIRMKAARLLQPELTRSNSTKLSFVIYLLRKELNADTIHLTEADLNMMKKLGIGVKYRNDGGTNMSIDPYEVPIIFPDGIEGSLTVNKGRHLDFIFEKNCKRGEDSN